MCSISAPRGLAEVLATFLGPGKVSWPVTLCGGTEEVAGDWWAGFVAGNGRVRLEELTTHRVPVECISGFSSHTPSSCTNKCGW